ncbi:hypothetical protein [Bacillus thuringiensis]|uniref:hypothetical protein n=1 Tax=Bacillus thuringiensis TaxID=1428 RepID=UPI0011A6F2C3|nr:hypothetical protein [Bacillus thuringiensis]
MDIEELFLKQAAVGEDFNYKVLYNDSRGAVYKDEYKSLIREAIEKNFIAIEKFIIAENVQEELYQIIETKGVQYTLIECLKNYHSESDSIITPLIYLLKKLDQKFTLEINEEGLKIVSKLVDVEIRPRIDGKNAEPRIYFPNEKVAITSTNDNVENLGDILAIRGVKIYIIGTDNRSNLIYAYKINRYDRYFDVAEGYKNKLRSELLDNIFANN